MDDTTSRRFNENSPIELFQLLNQYIEIKLIKNINLYRGFVNSVDPLSYSIIISVPHDQSYQTVLIPGHAILDVRIIEAPINTKPPERKLICPESVDTDRKHEVINWLQLNLLPVTEDGDKIVFGNASLLPPYTTMDICTNNPMVAMQMRKILEKMPHNVDSS